LEEKMKSPQFPTARKTGLVVQEVPDEVLVYDLDTNKAHCLNKTAAVVWQSCNGKNSISDIASIVGSGASDEVVWLAIDQLNENNLLEVEMKADFAGQSRRDVLKKIGLAAVVAMPIVASLVAPKSALASASCGCTATSQCSGRTGCPNLLCCNTDLICANQLPSPNEGCI
jgi:hypothetical protein